METTRGMVRTIFTGCTLKTHMLPTTVILYILLFCFHLPICSARDALTLNECISDQQNETLISAGERFQLGFFEGSDHKRFVGIWYYRSRPRTVVWVGNRDKALDDDTSSFCIGEDGNLVIASENNEIPLTDVAGRMVKLFDSGNLVLSKEDDSKGFVWQSFQSPTDTFLPGMKMDESLKLISWTSHDDPAPGDFTFKMDQERENQYSICKKGRILPYWKSGLSGGFIDDDIPSSVSALFLNFTRSGSRAEDFMVCNHSSKCIKTFSVLNYSRSNTRLVMTFTGEVQYFSRQNESAPWRLNWKEPGDNCSVFKACGTSAVCNSNNNVLCKCLRGFEPTSPESWSSGDFSQGCTRKTRLRCSEDDKGNFSRLGNMKLGMPDTNFEVEGENECKTECLKECCQVYSFQNETTKKRDSRGNATCWIWSDGLYNIRKEYTDGGHDILLHLQDETELGSTKQAGDSYGRKKLETLLIALVTIPIVTVLASVIAFIYLQKKKANRQDRQENRASTLALQLYDSQTHVKDLISSGQFKEEDKKGIDLPFFDFRSILAATDNFSEANQLGKGGFGPVYKGKFLGDRNIAVKRLSSVSQQGLDEFKNEVLLIARLQHRNLVSLLGYCIEGGEKILLYEYMPNKSLDFFIFDRTLSMLLDWEMRFNIILGIARGLLYLHQDSRLRIIHRDLKTSNILLDHEMNPKISDFGLARIFDGKETQGTTSRVVGTYGYMSPEYALDGFFSVKSDVFSFGVVVLEIISGKRNTGFYNSEEALSLLGYAWRLWAEDRALDLVDQKLRESSKKNEILRCINVGLLCVQEDPDDRPSMSNVIIMLGGETMTLPIPKRPAFVIRRGLCGTASCSSKLESNIEMTATLEGR